MKKTVMITSALVLFGASVAMAAGHSFGGGKRMDRMQMELGLSDAQVSQIQMIKQEQRQQIKQLRAQGEQRIRALLTPEQAVKFDQFKQQRQQRGQHRRMQYQQQQGGF